MKRVLPLVTVLLLAVACGDVREYDVVMNGTPASVTVDSTDDVIIVTVATATATPSPQVLYEEDFAAGDGGFESWFAPQYGQSLPEEQRTVLEWHEEGFVRSWSAYPHRWRVDGFHTCHSPWYELTGEQPCWNWLIWPFMTYEIGGMDLNNATVEVTLRSQDHLTPPWGPCPYYWWDPCDLKVWVQAVNPNTGKGVNYIWPLSSIQLDSLDWHVESATLDPVEGLCAGTASNRADTYDCSLTAEQVLASPQNLFLAMAPLDIDAIAANKTYPIGQIDLDHVRVTR
jgi:hypothetical protein